MGTTNNSYDDLFPASSNSRLRTNSDTIDTRNFLMTRNLYTPNSVYPISDKTQVQNIANAVGSIASLIAPYKAYNLKNTWYGRLVTQSTPLTEIGLAMLGNQFALNYAAHAQHTYLPILNLGNLFHKGGLRDVVTFPKNYRITKKVEKTSFQDFLDSSIHYDINGDNPFIGDTSNSKKIENTETGQISLLTQALNQNIYKQGFGNSPNDLILNQSAVDAKTPLTYRNAIIGSYDNPIGKYKIYYNFFNNPYSRIHTKEYNLTDANGLIVKGLNNTQGIGSSQTQEYAPSQDFIDNNFGKTNLKEPNVLNPDFNSWVPDELPNIGNESRGGKIVWGRDGSHNFNQDSQGTFGEAQINAEEGHDLTEFKVYSGLLEYTRNLLTASGGAIVDQTRKVFKNGQNIAGFNGNALWVANDSDYANRSQTVGKTGVRQHSILDQYDRFAKAIRFNGSEVYQGNPDSVTFKSVLPRIHPTNDKDTGLNNKNLMFSIENLAVRVINNNEGFGIIDDEYGTQIPASEVGQFNGRLMWFPPYDITINETTNAKYESTVMVGRNEPMYSYLNSERSANLSFTLLIDYPQILRNNYYRGTGVDKHRIISEFFAFGGDPYQEETPLPNPDKTVKDIEESIIPFTGPVDPKPVEIEIPKDIYFYFPNDYPKKNSQIDTAIDTMYENMHYEIAEKCLESTKVKGHGLNESIYFITGLTGSAETNDLAMNNALLPPNFSQYNQTGITGQGGKVCELNKALIDVFSNKENRQYYGIGIAGGASKLYTEKDPNDVTSEEKYNMALGERRAKVAEKLVRERIKALFGDYPENIGITVYVVGSYGSILSLQENATKAKIPEVETIQERFAFITFARIPDTVKKIVPPMSENDIKTVTKKTEDKVAASNAGKQSNSLIDGVYEERTSNGPNGDAAILKGFQSVSNNYFYPAFHSQTPEDFHRRLTFLQQCMRQGSAKRFDMVSEDGILRAKNSVFGRQPICVLRIGDLFFTKVVIENLTIDYSDAPWDMNPEGFGMQPMLAKVTLQMKVIGGQSLKGPIDALQNAVSFNHYGNSNFTDKGMYARPAEEANKQKSYMDGILTKETASLTKSYNDAVNKGTIQGNTI